MTTDTPARPAIDTARRLVDLDETPAEAERTGAAALALAWALKELCYASWNSEPARAVKAAAALQSLAAAVRSAAPPGDDGAPIEALAHWTGGIARLIRGDMNAAAAGFDAAAAIFTRLGELRHAAETQVPKIVALTMRGRHDEAAACAEAAQRAFVELGDGHAAGRVGLNLGSLYLRSDRYALAARHYREAAVRFARLGDHEHSVMAGIGVADALTALGELARAARLYTRARVRAARHGFPVLEAIVDESMALLDLARGRYREALAGFEGARRRYERLAMPQNLAIAEKQLADAYLELRLLPEALAGFDAALERFRALDMPVDAAWTLVQRGRALALLARPGDADAALADAAQLFAAQHDNAAGQAVVALARAELALAGGDAAAAVPLARAAASGLAAAGLAERRLHADSVLAEALWRSGDSAAAAALFDATLAAARSLQLLPVQLRCLVGRGEAARAAGDPGAARAAFSAAIELFEDQRRALPVDELRSAFLGDHLQPFHALLRLDIEAHAAGAAGAAEVLEQLDRFRARALADRLGDRAGDADAEDDVLRDRRARLAWLYRRVQRLDDDGGAPATLTAQVRAAEHDLLERSRRLRLAKPPAASGLDAETFSAAALQAALGPADALVEYGVLDDELFACLVTRTGVRVFRRLASWAEVQGSVRSVRFQIEALRHGAAPLARHLATLEARAQAQLGRLHELAWAPLAPTLAACDRVLVVAHAQLGWVPFAALHDGRRCLAQRHQLAFAPSARVALHALQRRPAAASRVVAFGEASRLPHAGAEARLVAGLSGRGTACVDAEATLANLRAHAGRCDLLHFACHAQFRSDNPRFSALQLHDEVLAAESIETLRLGPCLVVLSACETALHEQGGGDEIFGLVRAFFVAGATRVVASLWPVDDASTAELMERFYAGLRRGQSAGAALRLAQLLMRDKREHPFYWASFVLAGGW